MSFRPSSPDVTPSAQLGAGYNTLQCTAGRALSTPHDAEAVWFRAMTHT
jgi:hypothetical protein